MDTIQHQLPIVYTYWASFLIVWSLIVCFMLGRTIAIAKHTHLIVPKTDTLVLITILIGAFVLFASIFLIPSVTVLFIEVALLLSLWYTIFLGIVNHLNIITHLRYCTLKHFG